MRRSAWRCSPCRAASAGVANRPFVSRGAELVTADTVLAGAGSSFLSPARCHADDRAGHDVDQQTEHSPRAKGLDKREVEDERPGALHDQGARPCLGRWRGDRDFDPAYRA
jgi:hypothetical protein